MMREFYCADPESLRTPAGALITAFPRGGIFLLEGEMGSGKTTFVRTVCELLGAQGATSPTFSLVNTYQAADGTPIVHMDLYRIRSLEEALDFGFEEYLREEGYLFIEWPDKVRELTGTDGKVIHILPAQTGRIIRMEIGQ
jgi:tRNA threonylcarbamoyladenosine biosynthesis protein TsaE